MIQNEYAKPVEYNTVLNPAIWDNNRLKSNVRGALLRMAEDFKEFIEFCSFSEYNFRNLFFLNNFMFKIILY